MSVTYAILGEDDSDADTVDVLIRNIVAAHSSTTAAKQLATKKKGYGGWPHLKRKVARDLRELFDFGCRRFVVCIDADGPDPQIKRREAEKRIKQCGLKLDLCLTVPVQEIEAWILADIEMVSKVITGWKPKAIDNPEKIASPKEHIRKLSEHKRNKHARYFDTWHNAKVAKHLRLSLLKKKCPSFRPLVDFVTRPKSTQR